MKRLILILFLIAFSATLFGQPYVTGRIVGSETPDVGIEGAEVVLSGYDDHTTTTDEDGYFEIFDIIGQCSYEVHIWADGYDGYDSEIYVEESAFDIGTIALFPAIPVPNDFIATPTPDHEDIILSWNYANYQDVNFRYDDGNITGQFGVNGGGNDLRFGATHYYNAVLYEITWYVTNEGGDHNQVDLYIYGLDENGLPDPNNVFFETTGVHNWENTWNSYTLDEPVFAPEGFFVGINFPDGYMALGTDDGIDPPYEYIPGTQWFTYDVIDNEWHNPSDFGYSYNFAIRAMGENNGAIYYPLRGNQPARKSTAEAPVYIDGYQMPQYARERTRETYQMTFYQFAEEDANDPTQWTVIHEGDYTDADSSYVIENWEGYPLPVQWVLQYESSSGETGTLLSNVLTFPPPSSFVTVVVTTNSNDNPQGALVKLENLNGDETYNYEMAVPENGVAIFHNVWLGAYTLIVTLDGFEYHVENVIIDDPEDQVFNVQLIEMLLPVTDGIYEITHYDVHLTWLAPELPSNDDTEGFELGMIPEDWTVLDEDEDGYTWEIVSGAFSPYTGTYSIGSASYINSVGELTPDNWLITPQIALDSTSTLSFWVSAQDPEWPEEHYVVRLSTTGIEPEDFTEILFEETLSDGVWHQVSLNLDSYAENSCYIAFNHCEVNDVFWMKIDDIRITSDNDRTIALGTGTREASKDEPASTDRSFFGYRIMRDGNTVVELQTGTEYWDINLPPQSFYNYEIYAVYTTGEAIPYVIGPVYAEANNAVPQYSTALLGNSPNPFNPETRIDFSIASDSRVGIEVFNTRGQRVKTLTDTRYEKGEHHVLWQGDDDAGHNVSSGIYFYRMTVDDKSVGVKKMIMLK